jgi:hypothetical protein
MAYTESQTNVKPIDVKLAQKGIESDDPNIQLTAKLISKIGFEGVKAGLAGLMRLDDVPDGQALGLIDRMGETAGIETMKTIRDTLVQILLDGDAIDTKHLVEKAAQIHHTTASNIHYGLLYAERTRRIAYTPEGYVVNQPKKA